MPSDFLEKVHGLPEAAKKVLMSSFPAEQVYRAATSYGIKPDGQSKIAKLVGLVFVNDIPLENLASNIQRDLAISQEISYGIAISLTKTLFSPLKEHFPNADVLIQTWAQKAASPTQEPKSLQIGEEVPSITPTQTPVAAAKTPPFKKPFRLAIQENKEILNQLLTANPIKIAEFEQPVRPTIKNWLSDYIKLKGTGYHDELERSDYLYKSANAANLAGEERAKLAKILKAYDEDSEVPIAAETKLILIEELLKKEVPQPKLVSPPSVPQSPPIVKTEPPAPPPPPTMPSPSPAAPPLTPRPLPRTGADTYREAVREEDLQGPLKPPAKPAPKIDGNIVNLKQINTDE